METCLIAAGANLPAGDSSPLATLSLALRDLSQRLGSRSSGWKISSLYRSAAFPDPGEPDFINACASFESDLCPAQLLQILHEVEEEFGRKRCVRWGSRVLDLDLLAVGQQVLPNEKIWRSWANLDRENQMRRTPSQLILPHPRLHERAFVLIPLVEIAPRWCHPVYSIESRQFLADLSLEGLSQIKRLPRSAALL